MKTHRNGMAATSSTSTLFLRQPRHGSRLRREDRIFQTILPITIHQDVFSAESPGDWGSRVLSEGDLSGSLLA